MGIESAENIKASVIDWLIKKQPNDIIIGNEVMYGTKRKVVDLLAIINNKIIAIEIKSSLDNLNRLPDQIKEYNKVFDKIIVISTPLHKDKILSSIDDNIGFYIIDKKIKKVHSPTINNNQNKLEILYSVSSRFLKKQFPEYRTLNSDEIRLQLSKLRKKTIHELLISFYRQRLSERFQFFMNDRGENTLIDDIPTLSSFTRIELF